MIMHSDVFDNVSIGQIQMCAHKNHRIIQIIECERREANKIQQSNDTYDFVADTLAIR